MLPTPQVRRDTVQANGQHAAWTRLQDDAADDIAGSATTDTTTSGSYRLGHWLPPALTGKERVDIEVSFVMGGVHPVPNGLRVYMVMKFRYGKEVLDYLPIPANERPTQFPFDLKKYYHNCSRWVPWCFVGCFDEQHINWSVKIDQYGNCYERLEFYASFTLINHDIYFPFTLKALSFRISLDGTGRSGDINLIPLLKKNKDGEFLTLTGGCYEPNVEYQVFTKPTSVESVEDVSKDAFTRMMVRNQSGMSGTTGTYTRVYAVLLFESNWLEDFLKFIGLSGAMLFIIPFSLGDSLVDGEDSAVGILDTFGVTTTLSLTQAALLFILPDTGGFTTTESVIVFQILSIFVLSFIVGMGGFGDMGKSVPSYSALGYVTSVNGISIAWTLVARHRYQKLVAKIRDALRFKGAHHVVDFDEVEKLI